MIGMNVVLGYELCGLAGITSDIKAECIDERTRFETRDRFIEKLPPTGREDSEELLTTLQMCYGAVRLKAGFVEGYWFSLQYGTRLDPEIVTDTYELRRFSSGFSRLSVLRGIDAAWYDDRPDKDPHDLPPTLRPATLMETFALKKEIERLQNLPSGGTNVLVPA